MTKRETRSLPPVFGACTLAAESIDRERRTVEVVFLSGEPIVRTSLFDDSYYLLFDITAKAADLSRLNNGGAVLDNHQHHGGVGAVLGRVERAWIADGTARATLRFSKRPEVDGVWQDVADGILGSVSMGVFLNEIRELKKAPKGPDSDMRRFRVLSWTPYELSLVGVPADSGAKIQASADVEHRPCRLQLLDDDGGTDMRFRKCPECGEKLDRNADLTTCSNDDCGADLAELAAEREESRRVAKLGDIARYYDVAETSLARAIKDGSDPDAFTRLAEAERRKRTGPLGSNDIGFGHDYDSPGARVEQMAEGISSRAARKEPGELGRRYHDATLVELAYEMLHWRGHHRGLDVRHHASRIVEMALHTTSDYPLLLGNVLNKLLLPQYMNAQPTFRMIAQERTFNDFRPQRFLRAGDFPVPLQVNEHGEIKSGTMGENQETVTLLTFGRIFGITRQALVNDDLGAFEQLASAAAIRVADFHNSVFFSTCITAGSGLGPALSDGDTVYHANHSNVTGAGALDVTRLGEGRQLMMEQTSIDGLRLNVQPRYILTSPESLTLAEQLVAQLAPTQASEVNPFAGRLIALGDANLTGTRFYLIADPARLPQYVYGTLGGEAPLRFEVRAGFEVEGLDAKVATDFACGAIESRAGVTGAGA